MTTATMSDFQQTLSRVKGRKSFLEDKNAEANVIQSAINPLLGAVGWDTEEPKEVEHEYAPADGGSVDLALKQGGESRVFIEAKKWKEGLDGHEGQVLGYYDAANPKPRLLALSNGHEWRLYLPPDENHSKLRRFIRFDIVKDSNEEVEGWFRQFLSLENIAQIENLISAAEREWIKVLSDRKVMTSLKVAWNQLVLSQDTQVSVLNAFAGINNIDAEPEHLRKLLSSKTLKSSSCLFNPVIVKKPGKLISFRVGKGRPVPVKNWQDLKLKVCVYLYKVKVKGSKKKFQTAVRSLKKCKEWFRETREKLDGFHLIENSGVAVKVKGNKEVIERLSKTLVTRFGFSSEDLTIKYG